MEKEMKEAALTITLKNTHLNIRIGLFRGMQEIEPVRYQLGDLIDTYARLEETTRYFLSDPVEVTGQLVIYQDRSEIAYRGHIREFLYETQYALWKKEEQERKKVAVTHLLAAKLELVFPDLSFFYCKELARDEIEIKLGKERAGLPKKQFVLSCEEARIPLFTREVSWDTKDNSGLGFFLDRQDLYSLKEAIAYLMTKKAPVLLQVL